MAKLRKYMVEIPGKNNLYYRHDFPIEYQDIIGKPSHKRSLGTPDPKLAGAAFAREDAEYHRMLDAARLGRPINSPYDKAKRHRIKNIEAGFTGGESEPEMFHLDADDLANPETAILVENYKNEQRIEELKIRRDSGKMKTSEANKEIEALQCLIDGSLPVGEREGTDEPLLLDAIDKCMKAESRTLEPITVQQKTSKARTFVEVIGNKPVNQYTRREGGGFLDYLNNQEPPLAVDTIRKYLRAVNEVFRWCNDRREDEQKIVSPTGEIRVKTPKKKTKEKKRLPFAQDELNAIFSNMDSSDYLYWPSLCSLYSSMRGGEIVGLKVSDIKKDSNGIWFFDVYGNRMKTEHSEREIPVHDKLIELGFLDHVATLDKDKMLFPSFAYGNREQKKNNTDNWQGRLSVNFTNYLKRIGIKHKKISFHSFRHSFVDGSRTSSASWNISLWIQGRTEPDVGGQYGIGVVMQEKQKEINKIKIDIPL